MGTTADKLAYLEGTKAAIREAISARGVELSESAPFREYAERIGEIGGSGSSMPPDPAEVYASQRPSDWLTMPVPQDNEMYILLHVLDRIEGQELYQPTGRIYFSVSCTGSYTVEKGTVTDGAFVPDGAAASVASGGVYKGEFTAGDCYSRTSDGMGQVMFRVRGGDILSWETSGPDESSGFATWNIVEIACRLPSATRMGCGHSRWEEAALTSLRYFAWYGPNAMTDMTGMCCRCRSLQAILALDTSKVTNMTEAFFWCSSLIALPALDTSKLTNMHGIFRECHSLYAVPELNTSGVGDMAYAFYNCYSLRYLNWLDTWSCTTLECGFYGCHALRGIRPICVTGYPVEGGFNGAFVMCRSLQHLEFSGESQPTDWSGDDIYLGDSPIFYPDLIALINSLPTVSGTSPGQRILQLDAIPGTLELTQEDEQLALSKGWLLLY